MGFSHETRNLQTFSSSSPIFYVEVVSPCNSLPFYPLDINILRSSHPGVFLKKGVLRNFAKFTGKYLCQSLFLNKVATLFKKWDSGTDIFLWILISKNTFFTWHLWTTASVLIYSDTKISVIPFFNNNFPKMLRCIHFDVLQVWWS